MFPGVGSAARGGPNGPKPGAPDGIGDDFPIDVWVMEYGEYGQSDHYRTPTHAEKARQRWLAADRNHRYWWYLLRGISMSTYPHSF